MASTPLKKYVKQLQNGDMAAFDVIYHETKNIVYYTILSILKDESLSEDFMQETFLKALEKIHSYKPVYSFKSWIVTIARNLAINEYNKRKREFLIDANEQEFVFGSTESKSEKELIVEEILQSLKDQEREIVLLHVIGDLKHREISEMLNIPIGTVTWSYNQAIKKLKSKYEER